MERIPTFTAPLITNKSQDCIQGHTGKIFNNSNSNSVQHMRSVWYWPILEIDAGQWPGNVIFVHLRTLPKPL
jgi:hypothetical protein